MVAQSHFTRVVGLQPLEFLRGHDPVPAVVRGLDQVCYRFVLIV